MAASQRHPARPLSPFAVPLMGGLCTVRNSLRSSSCPSAPAGESYGGSIHTITPSLRWLCRKHLARENPARVFPREALGPAGPRVLCRGKAAEPPRSPPPACWARGQLGFRSPFCRLGWYVHHKLRTDGRAAAYSKCERVVLGSPAGSEPAVSSRHWRLPQASPVPSAPLGFPSTAPPVSHLGISAQPLSRGSPTFLVTGSVWGRGEASPSPPCFDSRCTGKLVRKDAGAHK